MPSWIITELPVQNVYNLNELPRYQLTVTNTQIQVELGEVEDVNAFAESMKGGQLAEWWEGRFAVDGVVPPQFSLEIATDVQSIMFNADIIWTGASIVTDEEMAEAADSLLAIFV